MESPLDVSQSSFKFDISSFLPEGHEKAFKQAFYNVASTVFALFISVACVAVYYVLQPFLRPLIWAVLFGSVLHPFKQKLTVVFKRWLHQLQVSETPFTVGAITAPFLVIDSISEKLWEITVRYMFLLISVIVCVSVVCLTYLCVPNLVNGFLGNLLNQVLNGLSSLLEFCNGATIFVWTIVIGYVIVLSLWWTPKTKPFLKIISPFIWTILICHLVNIAGSLRLTILLVLFCLLLIGFMAELKTWYTDNMSSIEDSAPVTPLQVIRSCLAWFTGPSDTSEDAVDISQESPVEQQNVQVDPKTPEKVQHTDTSLPFESSDEQMSNFYIYGLIWSCFFAQVWLHLWLFSLLLIPCLYMGLKHAALKFGLWNFIKEKSRYLWNSYKGTFEERKDAVIPAPVRGLYRILISGDKKFLLLLESSIDTFTSLMSIFAVFLFALIGTIFLSVQIYGESMHLVTVTSSLINRTVHNTDIQQLVPESLRDVQGTVDAMLDDAFMYGRGWISASVRKKKNNSIPLAGKMKLPSVVRRIIDDQNDERAAALEKQILEIFDRVYELWHSRNSNSTSPDFQHVASFDSLLDGLKTLNMDLIVNFIKENIGTFLSVLDSVWTILKGNISLAFSAVYAIFSLLFGGGSAVMNFVLNLIVFSTSLFYLLCASGTQYKPVEVCSNFMPSVVSGTHFGRAVEQSINGVFAASFKMALFYGLYTWLINTLFDVKIIYIPSVLAAIFGAVPFLGTYWACLPAVLELWLVNGQLIKAILMIVAQLIPTSFVDSAIYSEIKGGGHPYLTGLAIAGGVFCFGFEGALFGPMLLCVLFVAMHMYGAVINPSSFRRIFTLN